MAGLKTLGSSTPDLQYFFVCQLVAGGTPMTSYTAREEVHLGLGGIYMFGSCTGIGSANMILKRSKAGQCWQDPVTGCLINTAKQQLILVLPHSLTKQMNRAHSRVRRFRTMSGRSCAETFLAVILVILFLLAAGGSLIACL